MAHMLMQQAGNHILPDYHQYRVRMQSTAWVNILNLGSFDLTHVLEVKQLTELPPPLQVEDMDSDIICAEIPAGHSLALSGLDGLMECVISDEILYVLWYLPTGMRTAIQLGPWPALPTAGPIVMAQTCASSHMSMGMPQLQTAIELLAEDRCTLRCTMIRYLTGSVSAKLGPALCSFCITTAAGADVSLIEAAILADALEHQETYAVLAVLQHDTDTDTAAQRNLLTAQVLLFRSVDAFLNSFVHPELEATWWLQAAPDILSMHRPFLHWRSLRPVCRWWCLFLANKADPLDFSLEASYVGAQEDTQDEEMLSARRAIKEAEAARPCNAKQVLEVCEACEEIHVQKQKE